MLFNSIFFLVIFFPIMFLGWYALNKLSDPVWKKIFLFGMSLWFYGYYNVYYLWILIGSLLVNYLCALGISKVNGTKRIQQLIYAGGITVNLGLLFVMKYLNFFVDSINSFFNFDFNIMRIALPLGISFFTFQQISYLADLYHKGTRCYRFIDYACYVSFFPQLIAGPIVLGDEFLPDLTDAKPKKMNSRKILEGFSLFTLGFAKKVLLADSMALLVNAEFENIQYLDMLSAWATATFYTFELYWDFSGYCDMARGLARMLGFELPLNFDSPLRVCSIKDFWKKWHITLGRFLTKYVYIPLGGNRKGKIRKYINLFIVFLLSGIWHGANWTYIVWGIMQGVAVVGETVFSDVFSHKKNRSAAACDNKKIGHKVRVSRIMRTIAADIYILTSMAVFRSSSLSDAGRFVKTMFSFKIDPSRFLGICCTLDLKETHLLGKLLTIKGDTWLLAMYVTLFALLLIISIVLTFGKSVDQWIEANILKRRAQFLIAVLFVWSFVSLSNVSTFLYFNF